MARINDGVLRNWNNGETMTEALYEQEREIFRAAINDNNDRVATIEADLNGLDMQEIYETNARIELFYLNNDNNMRPVTFADMKAKNLTYNTLKHGYVRFHLFRLWRFEGGNV